MTVFLNNSGLYRDGTNTDLKSDMSTLGPVCFGPQSPVIGTVPCWNDAAGALNDSPSKGPLAQSGQPAVSAAAP